MANIVALREHRKGIVLSRDGHAPPAWERLSRKDIVRIGASPDATREAVVALRFREFMGTFVEHCHNTQHEDHAQLLRWDLQNPGQTIAIPTPRQTWEGSLYEPSFNLAK